MDLSIIIVSWNVKELLRQCLVSIFRETKDLNFEVFVVDNNSHDDTALMVEKEFPRVKLIVNQKNLGFAKANNLAIKEAKGDYVLLLNPDTEILSDALVKMVAFMKARMEVGIVGPKIFNRDMSAQPSVRRFPDLSSQALIMLKLHRLFPGLKPLRRYFVVDFGYSKSREVEQVEGAFFMINRRLIEDIGMLDEKFWLWFEEVDYCKRAKDKGWKVYYNAQAEIIHYGGESFKQWPTGFKKQMIFNHSMLYYFRKHHSWLAWLVLSLLNPFSLLLAWLVGVFVKL